MTGRLSPQMIFALDDKLRGTCMDPLDALATLNIELQANDPDAVVVEAMSNRNLERCPHCDWWCETFELVNDDEEVDGHCDNCR